MIVETPYVNYRCPAGPKIGTTASTIIPLT